MYANFYRNILFPFYETFLRRRETLVYLKELEKNQWLPEEELRKIQWEKLQKLLKHVYENVPYYRMIFEERGLYPEDIKTPEDFRKLPFLTKAIIQNNQSSLIAQNYRHKNTCKNETGGSTAEPIKFVFARDSYERHIASAIRSNRWIGWDLAEKTTLIWGTSVDKQSFFNRLKVALHHCLIRRQFINAFYLSEKNLKDQINRINKFKPRFLESYVSSLYAIAKFIDGNKMTCVKPKAIITSAETLYDYQRELIEKVFGCKIFNRYGCSETMLIAAECEKHNGMHLNIDNLYIEFLKDNRPVKFGDSGEIVLTDSNNYGMPFIRYKVGDIGIPSARHCECGRGFPLIETVKGRTMDILLTFEGNFIQPQIFCFLFKEFDWIKQYQIVQEKKGFLTFKIVKSRSFSIEENNHFLKRVSEVVNGNLQIGIEIVDKIPLTKSGKFRVVVSKVSMDFGNK